MNRDRFRAWDVEAKCWVPPDQIAITGNGLIITKTSREEDVEETWANYQTVDYIRRPDGRAFSEVSDGLAAYKADGFDSIQDLKDHIRLMSGKATDKLYLETIACTSEDARGGDSGDEEG